MVHHEQMGVLLPPNLWKSEVCCKKGVGLNGQVRKTSGSVGWGRETATPIPFVLEKLQKRWVLLPRDLWKRLK